MRRRLRRHMMPLERGGKHSPDHAGIDHSLLTSLRSVGARSVRRLQARGKGLPRVDNSDPATQGRLPQKVSGVSTTRNRKRGACVQPEGLAVCRQLDLRPAA